ncbi:YycH family regulatory protein [Lacticaseibacillus hegangensis]|uniref:YycH family regulatory protein n=1 Tax=Lacticaseibacillus hegangensis TaxID=2486010 RepID=A0ABW4CYR0_9LACO|nr:two-component system activity regulator YycH [Lacticaseibacillus hegangensis]
MKLSGLILRVSLTAMVLLSLVFSALIWRNPSRLGRTDTSSALKTTQTASANQQAAYLFVPTTAYYQTGSQKVQLMQADQSATGQIHRTIRPWRLKKISSSVQLSTSAFAALLTQDETLQLTFSAPVTFGVFNAHYFNQPLKNPPAFQFDRLIIDLKKRTPKLTLVDDATRMSRTATLASSSTTKLRAYLNKAQPSGLPVVEKRLNGKLIPYYAKPVALSPYAFLLDQQTANHFVSLLMPANSAAAVDSREIGDESIYTLGDTRMTLNSSSSVMQYEDPGKVTKSKSLGTALTKGEAAISQLNLQGITSMHYFSYDKGSRTVGFRSYAQGLPIFNSLDNGLVQTVSSESGLTTTFSLNNLTVAIPTAQATKTLPTTQEVLNQLATAGYAQSTIQDIRLGYYWRPQSASSQVVDLTPTYFVELNGQYKRYTEWLTPQTAENQNQSAAQAIR